MDDNNIIRINKIIFEEENNDKNIDDYLTKNTEKKLIIYSRKMWNNICIDINGNNIPESEYNKIDISFNIYTLFEKKNKLNLSEYGSINYILNLFHKLYEIKDINSRWRDVNPNNNLPNFDQLFKIFKNQYNIKSNNYIIKAWIPKSLIHINTISEDPNCSLNRSAYWNTHSIYILINNLYYLWLPEKWYCHEDAPNNNHYFIKPTLITNNISKINELKYFNN